MKYSFRPNTLFILLFIFFNVYTQAQSAKRIAPKKVVPLTIGQIKYTAPADSMGYIVAFDAATDTRLWSVKIYSVKYSPGLETDVQDVYIDSLYSKNNKLYIHTERKRLYVFEPSTRKAVRIR